MGSGGPIFFRDKPSRRLGSGLKNGYDLSMTDDNEAPMGLAQAIIQSEAGASISSLIANVLGVMGGDWVALKRKENLVSLNTKFEERQKLLPGNGTPVGPRVGMKALRAAADEDRPEMQELWATLLANGAAGRTLEDEFVFTLGRMNHAQVEHLRSLGRYPAGFNLSLPPPGEDDADAKGNAIETLDDLVRLGLAERARASDAPSVVYTATLFALRMLDVLSTESDGPPIRIPCDFTLPYSEPVAM